MGMGYMCEHVHAQLPEMYPSVDVALRVFQELGAPRIKCITIAEGGLVVWALAWDSADLGSVPCTTRDFGQVT